MRQLKRTVKLVREEPARKNGKARLFAYGVRAVAAATGQSPWVISRASKQGRVDLSSLVDVARFIHEIDRC